MTEPPIISVRNLCKNYRVYNHPLDRLKQVLSMGRSKNYRDFEVLKDVSFDIHRGETLGIVGRNGCGKSTLLQLICGIRKPTSGSVQVNGRISALLELGAGFHPEFTGRENVFMQGAIMGLTHEEMLGRFEAIAAFADIGDYIDQPVRTYSSGMFVRLAFAVAVHVQPDILIIDEVLAVGDAPFQQKCIDLISKMQSAGTTIIVVSHNPYHIERMCQVAAALNKGKLTSLKPAKEILADYHDIAQEELKLAGKPGPSGREGSHEVFFERVFVEAPSGKDDNSLLTSEPMRVVAEIQSIRPFDNIRFRFELCSSNNEILGVFATNGLSEEWQLTGKHRITFHLDACQLTSGWYYLNAIAGSKYVRLDTWQRAVDFKVLNKNRDTLNLSLDQGIFIFRGQWDFS